MQAMGIMIRNVSGHWQSDIKTKYLNKYLYNVFFIKRWDVPWPDNHLQFANINEYNDDNVSSVYTFRISILHFKWQMTSNVFKNWYLSSS